MSNQSKVLFIGNPYNLGGWSFAAESHIRALTRNFKVCSAHINLGQGLRTLDNMPPLEDNLDGCDICIQQVLPPMGLPDKRFARNIISYYSETDSLPPDWVDSINRFDAAVVSCDSSKQASERSGVKIPITVIPIPLNTIAISDKKLQQNRPSTIRNEFPNQCIFYTIADQNPRKNLETLLVAFHSEFAPDENVQLAIKLSAPIEEATHYIDEMSKKVKSAMRLYQNDEIYKKELVAGDYCSENDLVGFHLSCDIFVNCSKGEAYSLPSFTAFLLNNRCVLSNHTSFKDYFNNNMGAFMVEETYQTSVLGATSPPGLHTAREQWYATSPKALGRRMRDAYNDWTKNRGRSPNKLGSLLRNCSYASTAAQWETLLSK